VLQGFNLQNAVYYALFRVSYGLCLCLFQDPVVMPRVAKCSTASARGSFKDVTPIRHKGKRGLHLDHWQRSDQELEMKVDVVFIRFIFWKFA
jgi:hypothetical protein